MRIAVQLVLKDEGFRIPSVSAKAAVKTAEKLLEWCSQEENSQEFEHFATDLVQELDSCFKSCCRCLKRRRELMWKRLFQVRSSAEFRSKWSSFLSSSIGVSASPIFYQFVVDSVFNILLKEHHQIDILVEDDIEASLNYEEKNALRYTAGYVTRGLIKKLKRSCNPRKKQLIAYLVEMNTDEELPGVAKDESEDWVDLVDRGGLTHIGSMTFGVFGSMELEVRRFLARNPSQLGEIKEELCKRIVSDEDVLFYWAIISAGWGVEDSKLLLEHIIEYYVTIRGFSFASGWMEKYKQANKKSTQKSKGVRKQLVPPPK